MYWFALILYLCGYGQTVIYFVEHDHEWTSEPATMPVRLVLAVVWPLTAFGIVGLYMISGMMILYKKVFS